MVNIFKESTEKVWMMYRDGLSNLEIQRQTGYTINMIASAISRGRQKGIIGDRYYMQPLDQRRKSKTRRGSISNIIEGLSHEQNKWLIETTREYGCHSIAETILELVRDAYETEKERA